VNVNLTEWIVAPDPDSIASGSVTFNADNIGGQPHELVIVRTDLDPADLPVEADGSFDEDGAGIEVAGRVEPPLERGEQGSVTVDLAAGAYVLLCNVLEETETGQISHFEQGMSATFAATP
jgi:hypothetical protein